MKIKQQNIKKYFDNESKYIYVSHRGVELKNYFSERNTSIKQQQQ